MILALVLAGTLAAADSCPIAEGALWAHYADEWGHDERKPAALQRSSVKLGSVDAQWMYWKKTCSLTACDVTFVRKLPNGCWHPLLSVQGRLQSLKKGDWSSFTQTYNSSAISSEKSKTLLWTFDPKTLKFTSQPHR